MARPVLLVPVLAALCCSCSAFLTAVSTIKECIDDGSGNLLAKNGSACGKRLIVAMTVEADEGNSQYLEANIGRVQDSTTNKRVQLKKPLRIRITKSPVLINYRLYQVGYVNDNPQEKMLHEKNNWCRDDWFAREGEAACGFQYVNSKKIFDSQGFCCHCNGNDEQHDRGEAMQCLNRHGGHFGHCMRFDHLYHYVMGFYPPQLMFTINITIEQVTYTRTTGEAFYKVLDSITLSPFRRKQSVQNYTIQAEYIADFHSGAYMPVLAHKYLLIPDHKLLQNPPSYWKRWAEGLGFLQSLKKPADWLAVGKENFGLSGYHCNKIGVSYQAFRNQPGRCTSTFGSCLLGQPHQLWQHDMTKRSEKRVGSFMLHNFGKVYSAVSSTGSTDDFQVTFIAKRKRRSLITIRMEADSLKVVINKSPGRIVEAYIESFEALSSDGLLNIIVQNTGSLTATYKVYAAYCSPGVDYIPEKSVTIGPGEETNVTFIVHSFHAIGKINTCEVEMCDQTGKRLDNLTIFFETADTCFCHGHCGCSCGNNVSNCPPPPEKQKPDKFGGEFDFIMNIKTFKWATDLNGLLLGNLTALLLSTWVIAILIALGVLKVLIMIQTGQANCELAVKILKSCIQSIKRFCGKCCGKCCGCCCKATLNAFWCCSVCISGEDSTRYIGTESNVSENKRRPLTCDGMCRGAKQARRIHRKKLRLLKRRGANTAKMFAWWEKSYTCTCVVSDTKSICEIIKGLLFFFYLPILPLWWILEFSCERCMRNRRKNRRKAAFKKKKALQREKDKKTYLLLDKFSRGLKEKKVIDFSTKTNKKSKPTRKATTEQATDLKNDNLMMNMEEGTLDMMSEDESALELGLSANDTTDTDEAFDIDELLTPGYPVYFNYCKVSNKLVPKTLKNPGTSFSMKGRLTDKTGTLLFYLYKYTVQHQQQVGDNVLPLDRPVQLEPEDFYKELQPELALHLVTLAPLFPCLNDQPSRKTKKNRKKRNEKKNK